MTTQIRQQNGISILEPSGKIVGARSIRIAGSDLAAGKGFRCTRVSSSISSTSI